MAINMEDITSTKDGGVLKKIMKHGTGNIIPDGALVRGINLGLSLSLHKVTLF